ncbi:MAG: hypothetical protein KME63_07320 [Candidatus Thiodiazotropha sp. (ex Clathrolucina costata)]|nr:hypothetical protein [Candidatus Thiodiazotropha taylori]
MRDARPLIDDFFKSTDYEKLSRGVCAGFEACYNLMKSTPALSNFQTGIPQWSHLIRSYVEYGIANSGISDMTYEFLPNAARNFWHVRFHKARVAWTAHFVGGGENKRAIARKAIYKAELTSRTTDMFEAENSIPDIDSKFGYFQVLHAGYQKTPESITLAIPSRDQSSIVAATPLPIINPGKVEVEEVEEAMHIQLLDIAQSIEDAG